MPKIVSHPVATECPKCGSKRIKVYYDTTWKDLVLNVLTCFVFERTTRHYRCDDCRCVWID
jgi:hypothetical protein